MKNFCNYSRSVSECVKATKQDMVYLIVFQSANAIAWLATLCEKKNMKKKNDVLVVTAEDLEKVSHDISQKIHVEDKTTEILEMVYSNEFS